ncbi:hypothetical protein T10_1821 [Trichinella papuae]|uniref:Uncharacterized protein n=1 Tax=Trichinella papuae TaxID=268474 RepID=A0A0V1N195_9BILA|nr:hypothetical protein T10_1821 [Trichinella papuae]
MQATSISQRYSILINFSIEQLTKRQQKYTMISYVHFCSFIFYVLITMELSYYGILEKAFYLALQHMQWKHNLLKIKKSVSIKCQKIKKTLHCFSLLLYSMDRANSPVTVTD